MKNFYSMHEVLPKVHIENTNIPIHLEEMLKILIEENCQKNTSDTMTGSGTPLKSVCGENVKSPNVSKECFKFVLTNRPLDLLTDICLTDSPPGASVCILNWIRKFLTCLEEPQLDHKSILQPIQVWKRYNLLSSVRKMSQTARI